jgi:hypothetical protein
MSFDALYTISERPALVDYQIPISAFLRWEKAARPGSDVSKQLILSEKTITYVTDHAIYAIHAPVPFTSGPYVSVKIDSLLGAIKVQKAYPDLKHIDSYPISVPRELFEMERSAMEGIYLPSARGTDRPSLRLRTPSAALEVLQRNVADFYAVVPDPAQPLRPWVRSNLGKYTLDPLLALFQDKSITLLAPFQTGLRWSGKQDPELDGSDSLHPSGWQHSEPQGLCAGWQPVLGLGNVEGHYFLHTTEQLEAVEHHDGLHVTCLMMPARNTFTDFPSQIRDRLRNALPPDKVPPFFQEPSPTPTSSESQEPW